MRESGEFESSLIRRRVPSRISLQSGRFVYERQEDSRRKARVFGDTAVVTALLRVKGTEDGRPFEYRVWFSDTYVRISTG